MTDGLTYFSYSEQRRWLRLLPTITVAVLAVAIPTVILDTGRPAPQSSVPPPSPLGLRLTSTPHQVEVIWNHDSTAIHEAEKGSIRISDGDVDEEIPFDTRQLQDGALVYTPQTNDVNVRMEVDERDGKQVSESMRAVAIP